MADKENCAMCNDEIHKLAPEFYIQYPTPHGDTAGVQATRVCPKCYTLTAILDELKGIRQELEIGKFRRP